MWQLYLRRKGRKWEWTKKEVGLLFSNNKALRWPFRELKLRWLISLVLSWGEELDFFILALTSHGVQLVAGKESWPWGRQLSSTEVNLPRGLSASSSPSSQGSTVLKGVAGGYIRASILIIIIIISIHIFIFSNVSALNVMWQLTLRTRPSVTVP